jgi:serine/threonine protein kinase
MIGRSISHYVIQQKIGHGGMGEVYLARDTELDRTVALKILPAQTASDENRLRRFIQEAKSASALNHPGICVIHEIGRTEEKQPFIVMEYVDGKTIRSMISAHPIPLEETLQILIDIADALDEAHSKGIIHRDIKPENIMVTSRGQAKILDFGLAKIAANEGDLQSQMATETGTIMGTFYYMSPEQASGQKVDHRSDIFSLGVLMYELSTGRLPFSGKTITEVLLQIVQAEPPDPLSINPALPVALKEIIRKCIAKKPEDRYESAKQLVSDLKRLQRNSASMSTIYSASPMSKKKMRNSALAVAAVILLFAAVLIAYVKHGKSAARSIAVLPFANQSHDPDKDYLSDGITESIINRLSQLPQLRVIARSTVFSYKDKGEDPSKIGKELNVDAVATGSITQHGNTIIVQADLVNVSDRTEIWGEQYTRNISDVLAIQSEISKEISENLRLKLTGAQEQVVTKQYTTDPEAYRLYLQGRYHWIKFEKHEQELSVDYFKKAIERDPNYAQAYSGLADAYSAMAVNAWLSPQEGYPKARAAAQ